MYICICSHILFKRCRFLLLFLESEQKIYPKKHLSGVVCGAGKCQRGNEYIVCQSGSCMLTHSHRMIDTLCVTHTLWIWMIEPRCVCRAHFNSYNNKNVNGWTLNMVSKHRRTKGREKRTKTTRWNQIKINKFVPYICVYCERTELNFLLFHAIVRRWYYLFIFLHFR